ncbi:alcohol dehydrogenase catalytic domain-containing protein [Staphylococcus pasteuri]|uniref:alcohol dehydrogenase catalytic domain-containing protein n=1 Tax=Staphylococcus pasteuri TaxID=45972 RepID=UPI0012B7D5AF|nr:alcohol dehydrogenase catalytic domain-containing protein [Staphylococcus pasteuri]MCT1927477.1 zinc-binding dehydrogenase [Staphylococcus pasteuri]
MINQIYRLTSPRQFEVSYDSVDIFSDYVIVRPQYLSICAADQRYYTGNRDKQTLKKKLPMSLIHEGVGEVVFDSKGIFKIGTKVVMVPNTPIENSEFISENYLPTSQFKSSGYDGFMQDFNLLKHDRVVPLPEGSDLSILSYTELVTVSLHAIDRFEQKATGHKSSFGVWGDGNLGYITALLLRKLYPEAKIYVFGKTDYKLSHFSFVNGVYHIDNIADDLDIDHGFECVGGKGSQDEINQIINLITPEGSISLLGVSEMPVEINTRLILEKGLTVIGSSRSGAEDFKNVVNLYEKHPDIIDKLALLKGEEFEIRTINDVINAFESDLSNSWGKTVLKWIM